MLKLTKTGIGLLTKQYRSVLRKCFLLNLGLTVFVTITPKIANSSITYTDKAGYYEGLISIDTLNTASRNNGFWIIDHNSQKQVVRLQNRSFGGGELALGDYNGQDERTHLTFYSFRLNGSSYATGIDFAANVTAGTTDASHLTTTGAVNQLLNNYYYTFLVDERIEVIDSASFFQKNFSTLQEVDLQSKNPTHLGAFAKCSKVCPRLSELFASSLIQEQMFKNDASIDAGTSRHCLRQFGDVVADLLKNMASKYAKMNDFMNVEVCHA